MTSREYASRLTGVLGEGTGGVRQAVGMGMLRPGLHADELQPGSQLAGEGGYRLLVQPEREHEPVSGGGFQAVDPRSRSRS
jgi:hypothetical protein